MKAKSPPPGNGEKDFVDVQITGPGPTVVVGPSYTVAGTALSSQGTLKTVTLLYDSSPVTVVDDSSDLTQWHATITIRTAGPHTLTATATDDLKKTKTVTRHLNAVDGRPVLA